MSHKTPAAPASWRRSAMDAENKTTAKPIPYSAIKSPEDVVIDRLRKALGRIASIPRKPGDDGEAQRIAREALRHV